MKGNFLTLVPGKGDRARHFTAVRKAEFSQEQSRSVALKLIAESSFGLEKDAQILYRGVAVGSVTAVKLAADKVEFDVLIDKQYASLVRSQSRFYVTGSASAALTESGLSVSIPPAKQVVNRLNQFCQRRQ